MSMRRRNKPERNRPKDYQAKIDELKALSSELIQGMEDGSFYQLPIVHRVYKVRKVKRLFAGLVGSATAPDLRGLLLATAVLLASPGCDLSRLDNIVPPGRDKTNTAPVAHAGPDKSQTNNATFSFDGSASVDPDGDELSYSWTFTGRNSGATYSATGATGSVDLSESDFFDATLEVTDDSGAVARDTAEFRHFNPSFASPQVNPFGLDPSGGYQLTFNLADLDDDGDLDAVLAESLNDLGLVDFVQQNTGDGSSPSFAARDGSDPYGFPTQDYREIFNFAFADMDADGDLDMVLAMDDFGPIETVFSYNEGTTDTPAFQNSTSVPTNLTQPTQAHTVAPGDFDNDGDYDLMFGLNNGYLRFVRNVGTAASADFGNVAGVPLFDTSDQRIDVGDDAQIAANDLDGDGDLDLLVGDSLGNIHFLENTGTPESFAFAPGVTNPFGLTSTAGTPSRLVPADIDADGDIDIFTISWDGSNSVIEFFENTEF